MKLLNKLLVLTGKASYCAAVVPAAGSSSRMKGENKILSKVGGVPVIIRTLRALSSNEFIDEIVVVTKKDEIPNILCLIAEYDIKKVSKVIEGGDTRCESVLKGVYEVSKKAAYIAVHDGARPFVSDRVISDTIKAACKYHAAAPYLPVKDTVKVIKDGFIVSTPDRSTLAAIQTPQVFDASVLKGALQNALNTGLEVTDDCSAVEALGASIRLVEGDEFNIKITTPKDMVIAEEICKMTEVKK